MNPFFNPMGPCPGRRKMLLGSLLWMSALFPGATRAADAPSRFEVVFALPASRETAPDARQASGAAAPVVPRKAAFEPDLVGHSGVLGVRLGPGAPSLDYEASGNLPEGSGRIVLRFLTERLGRAEGNEWALITIGPEGGTLRLSRRSGGGLLLEGVDARGTAYRMEVGEPPQPPGRDTEVEIRYTPETVGLAINGRMLAERHWAGAPPWNGVLRLGDESAHGGEPAVLSLLQVRPATTATAAAPAPSAERTPNGPPTPWWAAGRPRLALEALDARYVPPPFEPIHLEGTTVRVWNRSYLFGGEGVLEQVVSGGKNLLRQPVTLRSGTTPIPFDAPRVVSRDAGRVVLERIAKLGEIPLRATLTVEYDGMVWIELEGDLPESLSLEVPFGEGTAESVQYVGAPARYESQNLARNSGARALPAPGESLALGFKTYVWVGNTESGLQWFAESDEGWWPVDRNACIRITRQPEGGADLTLNVRESAPPPAKGVPPRLCFGFMATPVKPMPEGWRSWTFTAQYGSPTAKRHRGNHVIYWPDEWRTLQLDPEPHRADPARAEATRVKIREDRAAGRRILPYWTRIHLPVFHEDRMNPDAAAMAEAWGTEPNRPPGARLDHRRVSMATGWADYLVWCFNEWGEHFGPMDGLYLDETQPIPNRRAASNGGYDAPDGKRRPTFEFRGSRDYMKRIHYLARKRSGGSPRSMIHNSSTYCLPSMSEYTVFLTGEQFNSGYFQTDQPEMLPPEEDRARGYYYCHVLPMDRLIAEGYWKPWGVPIAWLPQLKNQKDIMESRVAARDLLSRLQQVDTLIWPLFINRTEVHEMLAFREAFGIGAPEVIFVPFWENREIRSDDAGVKVAFYRRPGQRLLIVSNLNHHDAEPTLTLSDTVSGTVTDAVSGEPVTVTDGRFRFPLPRNDYRAFLITDAR